MTHHLAALDSDATDDQLARAITGYLLNAENPAGPFKLAYKHNANKDAPPHVCDRIVQGHTMCAVERKDKEWCRTWLIEALAKGLYVQRFSGQGYFTPIAGGSVAEARKTIEARKRMADFDAKRTLDDEIPF
jgi:hypothetical protein